MLAYLIADGRRTVFDGTGAMLYGGRWNSPGRAVIYAAERYATAMLEVLAHANLSRIPKHHVSVQIEIPAEIKIERIEITQVDNWPHPAEAFCRGVGDRWLNQGTTAVLIVPSIVTGGHENNLLINPAHQDFAKMRAEAPLSVHWDPRLFAKTR